VPKKEVEVVKNVAGQKPENVKISLALAEIGYEVRSYQVLSDDPFEGSIIHLSLRKKS
jgi:hypothetical protein